MIASYYRQLTADIKMKNFEIKTSFVSPEGLKADSNRFRSHTGEHNICPCLFFPFNLLSFAFMDVVYLVLT